MDSPGVNAAQLCVEVLHGAAAHRQLDSRIEINFMKRLTQYGSGQNKLVLTPQSRGLGIIIND